MYKLLNILTEICLDSNTPWWPNLFEDYVSGEMANRDDSVVTYPVSEYIVLLGLSYHPFPT